MPVFAFVPVFVPVFVFCCPPFSSSLCPIPLLLNRWCLYLYFYMYMYLYLYFAGPLSPHHYAQYHFYPTGFPKKSVYFCISCVVICTCICVCILLAPLLLIPTPNTQYHFCWTGDQPFFYVGLCVTVFVRRGEHGVIMQSWLTQYIAGSWWWHGWRVSLKILLPC